MGGPKTHRLFFALWPGEELRERIAVAVKPALEGRRCRPISSANLHITLAFLGSVPENKLPEAIDAGNEITAEPFGLKLEQLESWRDAHVACMTISQIPEALSELVSRLRFNLLAREVEVDQKDFKAHVTIARDWRDHRLDMRIAPLAWRVEEFVLVQSKPAAHGSEYRIVQRWPLQGGGGSKKGDE